MEPRDIIAMWFAFVIGLLLMISAIAPFFRGEPLPPDRADMIFSIVQTVLGAVVFYLGTKKRNGKKPLDT